jgi:hypothetical protein
MPERPDLGAHSVLADERVVLRHGAVGIEADDLAEQAVHALRLGAALGNGPVAERDEQHAVAREHEATAEVQRRRQRRRLMEDHLHVLDLRQGAIHEPAACHGGVVHAAVTRLGVAPVDQLIGGERRVEAHVEQAALAARSTAGSPATGSDICLPSALTTRSRPGRSVTSILPLGRNARPHGLTSPR